MTREEARLECVRLAAQIDRSWSPEVMVGTARVFEDYIFTPRKIGESVEAVPEETNKTTGSHDPLA